MIKFLKFVPVQFTFFLILGILSGYFVNFQPIYIVWVLGILLFVFSLIYYYSNKLSKFLEVFTVMVYAISFLIGVGAITFKNQLNQQLHYSNNSKFKIDKSISSIIQIEKELKPNLYYNKYEAKVLQTDGSKSSGRILVNFKRDSSGSRFQINDRLAIKSIFTEIRGPMNPYAFDYKKYLERHQIYHQVHLNKEQFLVLDNGISSIKGVAGLLRLKINESLIANGFENNELAVINALLLGQRTFMTKELLESYSGAGAMHILAVSGLHIGIILMLLTIFFKPLHFLKNGKRIATFLIIILLWIYAVIAGLSPSVVRAVTMFTALTIGMGLVKRTNVYNTLVISMFFLLLFNPYYLFEVGFQLSYLAVFSIVWIQPKVDSLWKPKFWLFKRFWQLFTVSMAAQIGVLPLSLYYFHQFPGLFFLTNLVIIPFLGLILSLGILTIILSYFDVLPEFFKNSYQYIIQLMNQFVEWVSSQEYFIVENITYSLYLMLGCYLFIFVCFKWIEKKVYYRSIWILCSVLVIQSILIRERYIVNSTDEFVIFNNGRRSIIGNRVGNNLKISTNDSLNINGYSLKPYLVGSGIENYGKNIKTEKLFKFKNETILIVDSLGIYEFRSIKPTIIVLKKSPKINLKRLLKRLHPKLIIADGSNYKSYVSRWEQTCIKNKTPFHSTMQKGAYILR